MFINVYLQSILEKTKTVSDWLLVLNNNFLSVLCRIYDIGCNWLPLMRPTFHTLLAKAVPVKIN